MKPSVTIALDAMGGDHGPGVVVPAALEILGRYADVSLVLVGDKEKVLPQLREAGFPDPEPFDPKQVM